MADILTPEELGAPQDVGTTDNIIQPALDQTADEAAVAAGYTDAATARSEGMDFALGAPSDFQPKGVIDTEDAKDKVTRAADDLEEIMDYGLADSNREKKFMDDQPYSRTREETQKLLDKFREGDFADTEGMSADQLAYKEASDLAVEEAEKFNSDLDSYRTGLEEDLQGELNSIKESYGRKTRAMQNFNQNQLSGKALRGARTGRQRYAADLQMDIMSTEESAGMTRISDLDSAMKKEMNEAKNAWRDNDFQLLTLHSENAMSILEEKKQAVLDMAELSSAAETRLMDKIRFSNEQDVISREKDERLAADAIMDFMELDVDGNVMKPTDIDFEDMAEQFGVDISLIKKVYREYVAENQTQEMVKLTAGQTLYDPNTGEAVYTAPKDTEVKSVGRYSQLYEKNAEGEWESIATGSKYYSGGTTGSSDTSDADIEKLDKAFYTDVESGLDELEQGRNWGSVWNTMYRKYENKVADKAELSKDLDELLEKDFWYEEGAYRDFKQSGQPIETDA